VSSIHFKDGDASVLCGEQTVLLRAVAVSNASVARGTAVLRWAWARHVGGPSVRCFFQRNKIGGRVSLSRAAGKWSVIADTIVGKVLVGSGSRFLLLFGLKKQRVGIPSSSGVEKSEKRLAFLVFLHRKATFAYAFFLL
jgi:hypothetical protein